MGIELLAKLADGLLSINCVYIFSGSGILKCALNSTCRGDLPAGDIKLSFTFYFICFSVIFCKMTDGRRYKIGYALSPKKQQSFIQPSLLELAKKRGIDLISIDADTPLIDQGPFDCVLHKLSEEDWKKQLEEYALKHPRVYIIDPPEAIQRLRNRISMLQVVSELKIPVEGETFGTPEQVVIYRSETLGDMETLGGLRFPVIAKPLLADGSTKSHKMSLVFNSQGLLNLRPPLVLQEFVNHGGVIFKVYVVGDYVKCVKRKSLPDVPEEKLESSEGSLTFCQISNMTRDRNDYYEVMHLEDAEFPPSRFVDKIAKGLRRALGLNLFNFDVIRDTRAGNRYLVIDINYFPGYAKMPAYESVLTDFFWNVFHDTGALEVNAAKDENSDCMFSDRGREEESIVDNNIDARLSDMIEEEALLCHNGSAREEGFLEDNKPDGIMSAARARDEGISCNSTDGSISTSSRAEASPP